MSSLSVQPSCLSSQLCRSHWCICTQDPCLAKDYLKRFQEAAAKIQSYAQAAGTENDGATQYWKFASRTDDDPKIKSVWFKGNFWCAFIKALQWLEANCYSDSIFTCPAGFICDYINDSSFRTDHLIAIIHNYVLKGANETLWLKETVHLPIII